MATERASNADAFYKAQTQGSRVGTVRGDEANADLNCIKTVITLEGDESASDVIKLTAPLRQGQVIVPALSRVVVPTATGILTAKIGTATDDDCIAANVDIGGAGVRDLGTLDTDLDTVNTGEEIIATLLTASGLTAGRTITLYLVTRSV